MGAIIRVKPNTAISKAIIVAEGKGGRFGGLTNFMHKGVFPIAGTPNIGLLVRKLQEFRVNDIYIATHYRPQDIRNEVGYGEKFGQGLRIHYNHQKEIHNTASAAQSIMFERYREDFKSEEYVWVLACDIGFPRADLGKFKQDFLTAVANGGTDKRGHNNIVGGIGFVVRPFEDFCKRRPTVVVSNGNLITRICDIMISGHKEGDAIRREIVNENVSEFEKAHHLPGLPFPTFFYILSRDVFEAISKLSDRAPSNIDFMRHLFSLFPGRLWAHFFKEEGNLPGVLNRQYYDFNAPIDYFRAQWQIIRTASTLLADSHTYYPAIDSFLGLHIEGVDMDHRNVQNSVVDDSVRILDKCSVKFSTVGQGCILRNTIIKRSVILPNTIINFNSADNPNPLVIMDSVVGAGTQFPTFIDSVHSKLLEIKGKVAVPNQRGEIQFSDLGVSRNDIKLCEEAFESAQEAQKE